MYFKSQILYNFSTVQESSYLTVLFVHHEPESFKTTAATSLLFVIATFVPHSFQDYQVINCCNELEIIYAFTQIFISMLKSRILQRLI